MEGIPTIGLLFMKYLFVEEVPSIEDYIYVRPSNALLGIEDHLEERSVDGISFIESLCVVPKTSEGLNNIFYLQNSYGNSFIPRILLEGQVGLRTI